jgi:hypothetical protein
MDQESYTFCLRFLARLSAVQSRVSVSLKSHDRSRRFVKVESLGESQSWSSLKFILLRSPSVVKQFNFIIQTWIRGAVSDGPPIFHVVCFSVGRMKDGSVDGQGSVGRDLAGRVELLEVSQPRRLGNRIRDRDCVSVAVLKMEKN